MNAVGIDVSKGKSMVAACGQWVKWHSCHGKFLHTEVGLEQMAYASLRLGKIPASS